MKILLAFIVAAFFGFSSPGAAAAASGSGYDPAANPQSALDAALVQAKSSHRKVLIIAGGDWCRWCLILNSFWTQNPEAKAELDRAFVVMKVYVGEDNMNTKFFSRLPKAKGYPHFWVMSPEGVATHSIDTGRLENGRDGYDKAQVLRFIREVGAS
jgi:hypothetical protein